MKNITKEEIVKMATLDLRKLAVDLLSKNECPTFVLQELILRNYER